MNLNRRPFLLITTLIFGGLALFFFGLYQREVEKDLLPSGTEIVGQIVQADLDVARRPNARLLWSKLESKAMLYRKDTIRTGAGSKVLVRLSNNSSIALGENTLVVLETENDELSLKLADGDVEFSGNITVALDGNTKLKAVDGTLRLKRDSSTGRDKVAAMSGKAQVVTDGTLTMVEQGEVLVKGQSGAFKMSDETITEAGLGDLGLKNIEKLERVNTDLQTKLNQLDPKIKVVEDSKTSMVRLAWTAPREASKYVVKIGAKEFNVMDAHFEIVAKDLVPYLNEPLSVKAIGSGAEGIEQNVTIDSATKDLVTILGSIPVNQIPFDQSRILISKKQVKLQWSDRETKHKDFVRYNILIQDENGKLREETSKTAFFVFEFGKAAKYKWSVQPVFKNYGLGQKSSATQFEIVGGSNLVAPVIAPASEEN